DVDLHGDQRRPRGPLDRQQGRGQRPRRLGDRGGVLGDGGRRDDGGWGGGVDRSLDRVDADQRGQLQRGGERASRLRRDVLDRVHGHDRAGRDENLHGDQRRPAGPPDHQEGGGQRRWRRSGRGGVLRDDWRRG